MYRRRLTTPTPRRGVILLVVVVLLTLFAIVGVAFVLYAESEANASRTNRDAEVLSRDDADPEALLGYFLNQLIYDASDTDGNGVYSVLRGHSLARLMLGYNSAAANSTPYNGVGRLHITYPSGPTALYPDKATPIPLPFQGLDDYSLVNYTYFQSLDPGFWVRDPERIGLLSLPPLPPIPMAGFRPTPGSAPFPTTAFSGGANASYTYPDLNNMFLAWINPNVSASDPNKLPGRLELSSFHRDWTGFNYYPEPPPPVPSLYQPPTYPPTYQNQLLALVGLPPQPTFTFSRFDPNNQNWYIPSGPTGVTYTAPGGWKGPWPPTNPRLKYWVMRPRPVDQLLPTDVMQPGVLWPPNPVLSGRSNFFPPPEDMGGDVQNLVGYPATLIPTTGTGPTNPAQYMRNDSVWLDLGAPVMVGPDGKKYKALFAPLILDLDGRVNLNVHGNVRAVAGGVPAHASNQGWGPWEVDLSKIFTSGTEWQNLFNGNPPGAGNLLPLQGRYGADNIPGDPTLPSATLPGNPPPLSPHSYAPSDYDGCQYNGGNYTPTGPITLPTQGSGNYSPFPTFPNPGYDNGSAGAPGTEMWYHPMKYNVFNPRIGQSDDRRFLPGDLEALLRYGDTGAPSMTSELFRLCPTNLDANANAVLAAKIRRLVTTQSWDVDRPGLMPWVWDPNPAVTQPGNTAYANANPMYADANVGVSNPYPKPSAPSDFVPPSGTPPKPGQLWFPSSMPPPFPPGPLPPPVFWGTAPPQGSDFGADWRSQTMANLQATTRLDLNALSQGVRLRPYPALNGNGNFNNIGQFQLAQGDRQNLARQIFNRLCAATGAINPLVPPYGNGNLNPAFADPNRVVNPPLTPAQKAAAQSSYNTARWLAQLAVNIVDYIDDDDVSTPFNWNPTYVNDLILGAQYQNAVTLGWVFGTEVPRLTINEVYGEVDNTPGDRGLTLKPPRAQRPFRVNFWVELHNPMPADNTLTNGGAARLAGPGGLADTRYQIVIAKTQQQPPPTPATLNPPTTTPPFDPTLDLPNNVLGDLTNVPGDPNPPAQVMAQLAEYVWGGAGGNPGGNNVLWFVQPANGAYAGQDESNQGFYVVGPDVPFPTGPKPYPTVTANAAVPLTPTLEARQRNIPGNPVPSGMRYSVANTTDPTNGIGTHTLLLRRLVCPYLPFQPNPTPGPGQTPYNPYMTVDYVENIPVNDGVTATNAGPHGATTITNRYSWARRQPYAAQNVKDSHVPYPPSQAEGALCQVVPYNPPQLVAPVAPATVPPLAPDRRPINPDPDPKHPNSTVPNQDQPQHTFFRHNAVESPALAKYPAFTPPLWPPSTNPMNYPFMQPPGPPGPEQQVMTIPFDWLVHLDRRLISPMELLQVSMYQQHKLTQQFIDSSSGSKVKFQHTAQRAFYDPQSRLYRVFEFFKTAELGNGVAANVGTTGRIPGKININMIWEPEVFQALCALGNVAPTPNSFTSTDVTNAFTSMKTWRSPTGVPDKNDRPILGMGAPYRPAADSQTTNAQSPFPTTGMGIDDTFFRPTTAGATSGNRWYDTTQTHPYQKAELMTKIYNNLTTRSNCFAVWVTVGFFEVIDDTSRPVKLGAEIGKAEGRNIRHRMFAIVDRSVLTSNPGPQQRFDPRTVSPGTTPTAPLPQPRVVPYYSIIQ
jgi:hypothetical protein